MITISTAIHIDAPARRTWELLTDFDLYPHWNPLVRRINGTLAPGERLELVMELPEIPPFRLHPVIETMTPDRKLAWQSRLAIPGILSWRYCFLIEQLTPEQQRFSQVMTFTGLLAPLFAPVMRRFLLAGAEQMNRALRKWAGKEVQCLRC